MLCSKCCGNIPQGKEMQIEGTMICKKCALIIEKTNKEKAVGRCWNCNRFIYKDELIHESFRSDSKNFSKWFSIEIGSSERLFQCDECYQKWRSDIKKKFVKNKIFIARGLYRLFIVFNIRFVFPRNSQKIR